MTHQEKYSKSALLGLMVPSNNPVSPAIMEDMVKRNKRLLQFFKNLYGPSVTVELAGTIHRPKVVINGLYYLAARVSSFQLGFLGEQGETTAFLTLSDTLCNLKTDVDKLRKDFAWVLEKAIKLPIFCLMLKDLYFAGYSFSHGTGEPIAEALWTLYPTRYYITYSAAQEALEKAKDRYPEVYIAGEPTDISLALTEGEDKAI